MKGASCQMLYLMDKPSYGKVNKRIKELKNKSKFSKVKQALKDPEVICYLNILQEQYVMCAIDKAVNNICIYM